MNTLYSLSQIMIVTCQSHKKQCHCPVCKATPLSASGCIPYNSSVQRKTYLQSIMFCPMCSIGVGQPLPSDAFIEKIYSQTDYWGDNIPEIDVCKQPMMYVLAKSRWSVLMPFLSVRRPLKIIDIGSGYGYFGLVSQAYKNITLKKYISVEADTRLHGILKSAWPQWNPDSELSQHSALNEISDKCDLIVLSHILEHVQDPIELLNSAKRLLMDDGLIFIDVPYRDYRFKSDVFPHLLFFSKASVQMLLESAGLQLLHLSAWGNAGQLSPLNDKGPRVISLFSNLLNKINRVLPKTVLVYLYSKFYGVDSARKDGAWLRAVARKIPSV